MRNMTVETASCSGDQAGDVGERRHVYRSGLDKCGNGEERHGGEIGVGCEFPRGRAFGPGHGAIDISSAEKNGDQQGCKNPPCAAAVEIRVA